MTINLNKRLHHRAPYLLLDEVLSFSATTLHARKTPRMDDFYLQGHFPGAPIVPGAIMQEMTTQAAGALIAELYSPVADYDSQLTLGHALGVLHSVSGAKYRKFARPNQKLDIKVELLMKVDNAFRFKCAIYADDERLMNNEFTLVNITDDILRG